MEHHWEVVAAGVVAANTPQELWQQACDYFKWCDEHPIVNTKTITSGKTAGGEYKDRTIRPYNLKAFCLHAGLTEQYVRDIRNSKDEGSEYYHVISRVLYIIYVQNHELATVGVFNPIFTAKVLNVGQDDTPAAPIKIEVVNSEMELSSSENEVLEKLELENGDGKIVEFVNS